MKKYIGLTVFAFALLFGILAVSMLTIKKHKDLPKSNKLIIALDGNPSTFDPHRTSETLTMQLAKNFYDTLLEYDTRTKQIVPNLATSYVFSNDNKTISFVLRSGVVFHDGTPFTSADVKASFERLGDEKSPHKLYYKDVVSIDIVDDLNFSITLKQQSASFLYNLCEPNASILPAKKIAEGWNFATKPVGTGILIFKEEMPNSQISTTVNKKHISNKSNLDEVEYKIITDVNTLVMALMRKDVDVTIVRDENTINILKKQAGVNLVPYLTSNTFVLPMNTKNKYLSDINLRMAIASAIDSRTILDKIYGGGNLISTFAPYTSQYYKDFDVYSYNIEKAKEYLAKSSYDESPLILYLPQNYAQHVQAGSIVENELKAIGINVVIKEIPWTVWISQVYGAGDFDLTLIAHTGMINPLTLYAKYTTPENYVGYNNPKIKEYYEKANATMNDDERKEYIQNIEAEFAKDIPFVYIGTNYDNMAVQKNIKNMYIDPILSTFVVDDVIKN